MATLTYDFAVVGQQNVKRALTSMERLFVAHDQKMRARFGGGGGSARAKTADPSTAARTGERKRHAETMAHVSREERARIRAEHRIHRIARRNQLRRARAGRRDREREAREQARAAERSRRQFRAATMGAVTGAGRTTATLTRGALATTGLMGTFAIADSVGSQMSADKAKRELANQAFSQGGGRSREELLARIGATTKSLSLVTGEREADVAGMVRSFTEKAGGLDEGLDLAPWMADLAAASGSEMGDIGEAAGNVFMAALQKGMSKDDAKAAVKDVLRSMAGQAKEGSIELRELANLGSRIISSGAKFDGDFSDVTATMAALSQMALAGGASSAQEATTGTMRLAADIAKKGDGAFKRAGVNVFADKGKTKLRDPSEILIETIGKTKGNLAKLSPLFGEESMKVVDSLRDVYTSAGGGDAGETAMREAIKRYTDLAMTDREVTDSATFQRDSTSTKLGQLRERFGDKLGPAAIRVIERLIPAFEKMIPHVEKAADVVAAFISYLADNPAEGIGLLIGAAIVKEIAAAGIASLIKGVITGDGGGKVGNAPVVAAVTTGAAVAYDHGKENRAKMFEDLGMSEENSKVAGGIFGMLSGGAVSAALDAMGAPSEASVNEWLGLKSKTVEDGGLAQQVKAMVDAAVQQKAAAAQQEEAARNATMANQALIEAANTLKASGSGSPFNRGRTPT